MFDLILAVITLLAFSILLFRIGVRAGSIAFASGTIAILSVAFLLAFATQCHGELFLAEIIPLSNVIVLGNWFPLVAALLAGILHGDQNTPRWRGVFLSLSILAAGWLTVVWNTIPSRHPSANHFENGICLQSSSSTCSACSAVTMLDYYGIASSEQEMATLCLTGGRGTNLLGIYRGLKLKTQRTPYCVKTVHCDVERLRELDIGPMIIAVRVPDGEPGMKLHPLSSNAPSIHTKPLNTGDTFLQILGRTDHCVVFFGFTEMGSILIGDPSNHRVGLVQWTEHEFRQAWSGQGFYLEKRSATELPGSPS